MKLTVYEKPESLGTVLLGIVEDVQRHTFDGLCDALNENSVSVDRVVSHEGNLPVIEVNDTVVFEGSYPNAQELSDILKMDVHIFDGVKKNEGLNIAAQDSRISACCGVGTDVYLDPYEDEE